MPRLYLPAFSILVVGLQGGKLPRLICDADEDEGDGRRQGCCRFLSPVWHRGGFYIKRLTGDLNICSSIRRSSIRCRLTS
jgi:hypothetical protein